MQLAFPICILNVLGKYSDKGRNKVGRTFVNILLRDMKAT